MDERTARAKTRADYRAEFQAMLEESRRLFAEMDQNRAEMERRRAEFERVGARTDANLRALRMELESLRRTGMADAKDRELAEKEREVQRLRIENVLLRFERRLPRGGGADDPSELS